jgi:hypothetical protein
MLSVSFHQTSQFAQGKLLIYETMAVTGPLGNTEQMDDSSYRRNFDLDKKNEIHYHSWKERLKMSKFAEFGCELL